MKKNILFFLCSLVFFLLPLEIDLWSSFYLKKENNLQDSMVLKTDYDALKQEYELLLEKSDLWKDIKTDTLTSKVILHDPYHFEEQITILKGKSDGVMPYDIVYNEQGYIGKVIETKENTSIVELLTSHNTEMQVKIENSYGILKQKNNELYVENITSKEKIKEGSIVYTSNYQKTEQSFPIGVVNEVEQTALEQIVHVIPYVKISELNYCLIRKSEPNE